MRLRDTGWLMILLVATAACDRNVSYTTEEVEPATCFNCHSDENTALVAAQLQWEHSVHGSSANTNRSTTPCNGCHTSEGFKSRIETGSLPALVNATIDALRPLGIKHLDMPFTPARLWAAIRRARA